MDYLEEEADGRFGEEEGRSGWRNGVQIVDGIYLKTKASGVTFPV